MSGTDHRDVDALVALIEARLDTIFAWHGGRDCASFAARCVKAQSGIDPRGSLRWKSRREARAVIDAEGGLQAAVDRRLRQVPPALAMRGDIAGVPDEMFGIRLMVVEGAMIVGPGRGGLYRQPRSAMVIAWDAMSAVQGAD